MDSTESYLIWLSKFQVLPDPSFAPILYANRAFTKFVGLPDDNFLFFRLLIWYAICRVINEIEFVSECPISEFSSFRPSLVAHQPFSDPGQIGLLSCGSHVKKSSMSAKKITNLSVGLLNHRYVLKFGKHLCCHCCFKKSGYVVLSSVNG